MMPFHNKKHSLIRKNIFLGFLMFFSLFNSSFAGELGFWDDIENYALNHSFNHRGNRHFIISVPFGPFDFIDMDKQRLYYSIKDFLISQKDACLQSPESLNFSAEDRCRNPIRDAKHEVYQITHAKYKKTNVVYLNITDGNSHIQRSSFHDMRIHFQFK